jgi:hypothetical protein
LCEKQIYAMFDSKLDRRLNMLTFPGVEVTELIYESANSLVYRAFRQPDSLPVVLKVLKENYPTPQELARYRTKYKITQSLNLNGCIKA